MSIPYPQEFTMAQTPGALPKEVGPASSGGSVTVIVMLGRRQSCRVMVVTKGTRKHGHGVGGMSRRTAAWLAWSVCVVCVVLIALALLLDFLTGGDIPLPPQERFDSELIVLTGVLSLAYPTVGALIASRLPTNPIGWIFCGVGLLYAAQRFTAAYADYVVIMDSALPGEQYAGWFSSLAEFSGLILAGAFVMLLF